MSEYTKSSLIKCEKCEKIFREHKIIYNVVNTDSKGTLRDDFFNKKLNLVKCPFCNSKFIFETKLVVYSPRAGYAIMVIPDSTDKSIRIRKTESFDLFSKTLKVTRLVSWQSEALEKAKIFESNLDDNKIEHIKRKFFDKKLFTDKKNHILLFDSVIENKLKFIYCDYLGNITNTYTIPLTEYDLISDYDKASENNDSDIWQRIDTVYKEEDMHYAK